VKGESRREKEGRKGVPWNAFLTSKVELEGMGEGTRRNQAVRRGCFRNSLVLPGTGGVTG